MRSWRRCRARGQPGPPSPGPHGSQAPTEAGPRCPSRCGGTDRGLPARRCGSRPAQGSLRLSCHGAQRPLPVSPAAFESGSSSLGQHRRDWSSVVGTGCWVFGGEGELLPTEKLALEGAFSQQGEELLRYPALSAVQLTLPGVQAHGLECRVSSASVSQPNGFTLLGADPGSRKTSTLPTAPVRIREPTPPPRSAFRHTYLFWGRC